MKSTIALVAVALAWSGSAAAQPPEPARAQPAPRAVSFEEGLALLDKQNLTLEQARDRAAEAQGIARQAWAALLPTVGASGSYVRNSAEAAIAIGALFKRLGIPGNVPNEFVIQPLDAFSVAGSLRVPLFAANSYWDLSAAREAGRAAQLSVDAGRSQLHAVFAQTAWLASAGEETVDAAQRALDAAVEHEASTARALAAGTAAPLARLQAQTDVVTRESELARARAELERAWLAVGVLLGRPELVRVTVGAPDASAGELDAQALVAKALDQRPEVKAQLAQIRSAEDQVTSAKWRVAPQVSASLSAVAQTSPFPTGDKTAWKASADLSWPLYDGGFRYGRREQAEAALAGANAALAQQRLEIGQQVMDAVRDIGVARERLRFAEQQVGLAKEAAASASRSFGAGLASSLDVLDANNRVYQAEVALADAHARMGIARASLARALGEL